MNKRIQELAEQAYGIDDSKPFHPSALVALEKFAELIVRDCAQFIFVLDAEPVSHQSAARLLQEHFGIEE